MCRLELKHFQQSASANASVLSKDPLICRDGEGVKQKSYGIMYSCGLCFQKTVTNCQNQNYVTQKHNSETQKSSSNTSPLLKGNTDNRTKSLDEGRSQQTGRGM